ncbi:GAF domain-containing sensor histidine kinase [Catenovulum sp. 2E275]|uniref:GAF domain-containing sensor histidine kinase n=1 Tax=Catenovulum sp. 2E275 TaxID=2980497 RepID=UPI0021CEDA06|nr:GAF domain-containing sensor histidine kinase [Catenovulum sp. 2E275]MCU4676902.1 GAF domain-containing sensor histidine kinase [Catenovulum sp. 2E275]
MKVQLEDILLTVSKSEMIDDGNIDQARRLIIHSLIQGLQIKRVGIWLTDADKNSIECKLLIDTYHDTELESLKLHRSDFPNYFSYLDTERAIIAHNAHTHPATSEFSKVYLSPNKINSMLDIPIRHKGKMIGIICCEEIGNEKNWCQDEITFASAMSDLYGRALSAYQRNQYQKQLEEQNINLEKLVQKRTQALESSLDDLKSTQEKLIESEKMASLGNLVAGVAHEVNTPIGVAITGTTHSIESIKELEKLITDNQLSKQKFLSYLTNIKTANELIYNNLSRAVDLIQNFKQTAADQSGHTQYRFNLGEYLISTLSSLKPLLKRHNVTLTTQLDDGIEIYAPPGIFAQIITILIQNACAHAFLADQPDKSFQLTLKQSENKIILTAQDNGQGLAKEYQRRVFEPFYTTNRQGGGTGLGLSILYNLVVNQLKGEVQLQSELQHGCMFTLAFPNNLKD